MSYLLGFFQARVLPRLRKLRKDDNGAAAVMMALLSPVLIGGMGLGAETGYWYYSQRKLQHAADVAAHAAGVRKRVGDGQSGLQTAAVRTASASGFMPVYDAPGGVTNLTVNNPPLSGAMKGKPDAVEVILSETKPRLLSSIFSKEPVQIPARAVAKLTGGSPACVLALSDTAPKAVEVSGSSSATLIGCSVAANSVQPDAYYMPNSTAYLSADCISTVGGASIKKPSPDILDLNTCSAVQENAPKTLDPYAGIAEPAFDPATCEKKPVLISGEPIKPKADGTRCFRGLSLPKIAKFEPGLYIFDTDPLTINSNGEIHGDGVTFFFANNATADLSGTPLVDLSAPLPDTPIEALKPYVGILFFGQRCNPLNPTTCSEVFSITGNPGSNLKGAIYLPGSRVNFLGNSESSSSCLQIIADTVTFTGNSTITMGSTCDAVGTKTALVGQVVKLVE